MSTAKVAMDPVRAGSSKPVVPRKKEPQCEHEVQFYFDERFLIRSLSEFAGSALRINGSVIIVATRSHRAGVAQELRRAGFNLASLVEQGRYVALDASDTLAQFTVNGLPDETLFHEILGNVISCASSAATARGGDARVTIFGEMVALQWQRGEAQAALQLERFWNQLSKSNAFRLRCAYPLASFEREVHTELFSRICCEHQAVIPAEDYTVLEEVDRLRTVARLQQTRQALQTEASERRLAQARIIELQIQNEQLVKEIQERDAIEDELRMFTRGLLAVRDEEQRRIAAELHENTAQLLAALSLYFGVLHEEQTSLSPRLASVIASSRAIAESLLNQIRKVSHQLHPPTLDDMGLANALREYVEQFNHWNEVKVDLHISEDLGRFNPGLEIAVFRIVEEALAIDPHAGSSAIVRLTRSRDALIVDIENHAVDACETQKGEFNATTGNQTARESKVTGIRERAKERGGTMNLITGPAGLRIYVMLPLGTEPA